MPTQIRLIYIIWILLLTYSANCMDDPPNFSTEKCFLTEPVYDHNFDFTGLRSDFGRSVTSDKGDIFEYNICGNLSKTCNGVSNVAACLKRENKEYILGTQHILNYHNGKMFFNYTNGDNCTFGTGTFRLHVYLECDYTLDKNQSQVTQYANDACSFYIKLETPLACLPEPDSVKSNLCNVKDPQNGHIYDLFPLSDANYRTTDHTGSAFVINICKPVLYSENAMCPPDSSICLVLLKAAHYKQKFINYGSVQSNPVIENGKVLMRLSSTTRCTDHKNISSIIYFYCDKDAKASHPEFLGVKECTYEFSFFTSLVCTDLPICSAFRHENELIDMRPLMNKSHSLVVNDKSYTFGICSSTGEPCLEKHGACLQINKQSTSLGVANTQLLISTSGTPYLLYEHGAPCADSKSNELWSTKIEFICADSRKINNKNSNNTNLETEGPKIVENTNCQLLIHYQTQYACQEQISCKVKVYVDHSEDGSGEEIVDLTPLMSETENYKAQIDATLLTNNKVGKSTMFYLNVCRPLIPKFGLGCPGGSSACMAEGDASKNPIKEQSLGFPLASPVAYNRTSVEIRYMQGGPCSTDEKTQLSTGIEFYCDMHAGKGTPILREINDCHYQFSWATNVICPPHMCSFDTDACEVYNDDTKVKYNVQNAPYTDNGKIIVNNNGNDKTIDICGSHRKVETDYAQGIVNIYFTTKGLCGTNSVGNVQVRLICNDFTNNATSFSDTQQCTFIYTQHTIDICKFLGLSVPVTSKLGTDVTNDNYKNETQSNERTPIGSILAAALSIAFLVGCIGFFVISPERRGQVKRLFRRSTSIVRYSRVQSNEEANLLLEPNGEFTDSDDDMLL